MHIFIFSFNLGLIMSDSVLKSMHEGCQGTMIKKAIAPHEITHLKGSTPPSLLHVYAGFP